MSVERYIVVTDKKKRLEKLSNKFKLLIVYIYLAFIWLMAIVSIQSFVHSIRIFEPVEGILVCDTFWTENKLNLFYAFKFIINFILPFSVILISSIQLIFCLRTFQNISRSRFTTDIKLNEVYGTFARKKTTRTKTYLKGKEYLN
jgi:hypothetical protein